MVNCYIITLRESTRGPRLPRVLPDGPKDQTSAIRRSRVRCFASPRMTWYASRSRGVRPSFALVALQKERAQGRPGARCTRGLVCNAHKETHTSIQVQRRHPAFPAQWFTAYFVLSPVNGFLATVAPRVASRELDASIAASGPHDFAVRDRPRSSVVATRVHRIPPRVRDDREPPLLSGGTADKWTDLGRNKRGIFCSGRLDDPNHVDISRKFQFSAQGFNGRSPSIIPASTTGWHC